MKDLASGTVAAPLSRYAPFRRAGDVVYFSGIIAADPSTMRIIKGYSDLPLEARKLAGEIGEMSSDLKDGPIAAQSWWILNSLRLTVEAAGGTLNDVVKLTQFFRNFTRLPDLQPHPRHVLRIAAGKYGGPGIGIAANARNVARG